MRWIVRLVALLALVLPAVAVYAILEPVAMFGYDGPALAHSLEGEAPEQFGDAGCNEREGGEWLCSIELDPGTGREHGYELRVDDDGCWRARPVEAVAESRPRPGRLKGCVDLLDIIGIDLLS